MADVLDRLTAALAERYRIERKVGAAGMATVYLADDLKHHRKVAVKVLRPALAAILGGERFLKEIEVTASYNIPTSSRCTIRDKCSLPLTVQRSGLREEHLSRSDCRVRRHQGVECRHITPWSWALGD